MRLPKPRPLTLRLLVIALLLGGVAAFVLLGGLELLSFEQLVARKDALVALAAAHPVEAVAALGLGYVVLGTFCLPGATVLHISGGVLFGFWGGLGVVCVASTLGTICGFLTSRLLLRDLVARLARGRLRQVEEGIAREGGLFVFAFRLLPVVPYSLINVILGACPIRFGTYVWVSFVASLPRYLLYVTTGTQLDRIRAPEDIYSPAMVATLAALGLVPLVVKVGWRALEPRLERRRKQR